MTPPRVAVFDLDGTLADTAADLIAAANAALAAGGLEPSLDAATDQLAAFAGGRAMLRLGFERLGRAPEEAEVDRLYPALLDFYGEGIAVHTVLYDGVEAALDRLAAADWQLAVCTNKPAALADRLLARVGIDTRFVAMLGADSLPFRKPDPRHLIETVARAGGVPARAVMVGDTVNDREAARAAGIPCVLMGFGPQAAAVAVLAPEAVLGHYDELPGLLERMLPRGVTNPAACNTVIR
jgi:phosphoglycolate phosphatase